MRAITENTKITLGVLVVFVGGIFWLSNLAYQTQANSDELETVRQELKVLHKIDRRLLRIELKLGVERKDE